MESRVSASTRVTGLIGDPVAHSLSPAMHNAAFAVLGLDYYYAAWRVPGRLLEQAIEGLRALGAVGFNVTVPHKVGVVPFLDKLDDEAAAIGAVNTIVVEGDGTLIGHNTDGAGFLDSLLEAGCNLRAQEVALFGAGGAARAVAVALLYGGAGAITIVNRSLDRAEELGRHLADLGYHGRLVTMAAGDSGVGPSVAAADLVIDATSVGLHGTASAIPVPFLHKGQFVADLVYNPLRTPLLEAAAAQGCRPIYGDAMLVHQGARSFTYWTGERAPLDVMRTAVRAGLTGSKEEIP